MNSDQGVSIEPLPSPSLDEDLRGFSKELRESWESLMARRAAGLVQTDKEELAVATERTTEVLSSAPMSHVALVLGATWDRQTRTVD